MSSGAGVDLIYEINNLLAALVIGEIMGWESTCGIKVAHHSEARAQQHADRLAGLAPYPCTWCLHWHVGHPLKRYFIRNLITERNRRAV